MQSQIGLYKSILFACHAICALCFTRRPRSLSICLCGTIIYDALHLTEL